MIIKWYFYFNCLLIFQCFFKLSNSKPLLLNNLNNNNNVLHRSTSSVIDSSSRAPDVLEFMRKFGYLEPPSHPSGAKTLYHKDAIVAAIKNVQKYGALKQTGRLDDNTLKLMVTPRCGVQDIVKKNSSSTSSMGTNKRRKRYVIASSGGWQKRKITYFIANWSSKIDKYKIASDMKNAFNTWAKYGNIKFKRVYDRSADIIISFGTGYHGDRFPFDGPGNILAHAFYPYEYESYGGDIHFDDDENWRENATNFHEGVDFYSVAVHELGHSLGLDHSPIESSIMFPYYKGPMQTTNTLDYDDISAMNKLYVETTLEEDKFVSQKNSPLNYYDGNFDAVVVIRGIKYLFQNEYVWLLIIEENLFGVPMKIREIFTQLPVNVNRIDAAYERDTPDKAIILFTGNQYWIFNSTNFMLIENSPRSISDYGIGLEDVSKIDLAIPWNGNIYLFAGNQVWGYNNQLKAKNYPMDSKRWRYNSK